MGSMIHEFYYSTKGIIQAPLKIARIVLYLQIRGIHLCNHCTFRLKKLLLFALSTNRMVLWLEQLSSDS